MTEETSTIATEPPVDEIKEVEGVVEWSSQKELLFVGEGHYNKAIEHIAAFRPAQVNIKSGTDQNGNPATQVIFIRNK